MQERPGDALSALLEPFAFLTCPSLTHHPRHTAECVLGHRCGQSGQCPGADQGKLCSPGIRWFSSAIGCLLGFGAASKSLRCLAQACQEGPFWELVDSWRATHP